MYCPLNGSICPKFEGITDCAWYIEEENNCVVDVMRLLLVEIRNKIVFGEEEMDQ